MIPLIGLVVTLVLIFGAYIHSGGNIEIILHALPHEMPMLMGGAIGAFLVGSKTTVIKSIFKELAKSFKSPHWKKNDYKEILLLLFALCKLMKTKGVIAVEQHVENPKDSKIFNQYPKILKDHFAVDLICDVLRMLSMGLENPEAIQDMVNKKIDKHHHESLEGGHALHSMADGLPAIGIVVAVLGVVKTMASINEPPAVLGAMIGGALVGTFLGVFMAYCIVGPMASRNIAIHEEEQQFYFIIRDVLVAHVKGYAPQISIEVGRGHIPSHMQPSFNEIEEAAGEIKVEA